MVDVLLKSLRTDIDVIPRYQTPGDAGADLKTVNDFTIKPGERVLVNTGICIALPKGYVGLIHPRSGLALKHGITIVNAPGTIDSGYRGEIKVCLLNTDTQEAVSFKSGDRIAQLIIQKYETAEFLPVDELPQTQRSSGGFGSTG